MTIVASPAQALAVILSGLSWPSTAPELYVDWMPDHGTGPDRVCSLSDLPGQGGRVGFSGLPDGVHSQVQVQLRAEAGAIATARTLATFAWRNLAALAGVVVPASSVAAMFTSYDPDDLADVSILAVESLSPPTIVDREHKERPVFAFTASVWTGVPNPC